MSGLKQRFGMSKPRFRWSPEQRRDMARLAAKDPEVERRLQELFAERPELKEQIRSAGAVSHRHN
jgi:hypothetical protein